MLPKINACICSVIVEEMILVFFCFNLLLVCFSFCKKNVAIVHNICMGDI